MSSTISYLRSFTLGGMAVFDFAATAGAALLFSRYTEKQFACTYAVFLIIAIFVHYLFGVPTMLNYYLGVNSLEAVYAARRKANKSG